MTPPIAGTRPAPATIRSGWATSTGHRRTRNEDAVLAGPFWFAVADGMGGHQAGDVAATIAVDVLAGHAAGVDEAEVITTAIRHSIADADRTIRHAATGPRLGMGTTIVGVAPIEGGRMAVFHVGDSRCYRLLDGGLELLTTDHTQVQELVDLGQLDRAAVARHPLRHVITRSLGGGITATPEIAILEPPVGRLLLCSDGLSGELSPSAIGHVLSSEADPASAARHLIDLVLEGPAPDNVTAVVVDVGPDRRIAPTGPSRPRMTHGTDDAKL